MIREYDVVELKIDLPDKKLKKGMKGTMLMIYKQSNLPAGYEIEFIDDNGNTLGVLILQEEKIKLIKKNI